MSSAYDSFDFEGLRERRFEFSAYQLIVNQDPFEWTLQDIEVEDNRTKEKKVVKSMRLPAVYFLLDTIYQSYNISTLEIRQIGKAIIVAVRLETIDRDGVIRWRDGTGFIDASDGVRNATAMAEANAIKNAAKKLGKVFGRDLYAEDEPRKIESTPLKKVPDIPEELVIQVEEMINPNYTAILEQLKEVKDTEELKNIGKNVMEKVDEGLLDGEEFEHLTDLINQTIVKLKKDGKTKVIKSSNGSSVSLSLSGGLSDAAKNKQGKGSGGTKRNVQNKVGQGGNRTTNRTPGGNRQRANPKG